MHLYWCVCRWLRNIFARVPKTYLTAALMVVFASSLERYLMVAQKCICRWFTTVFVAVDGWAAKAWIGATVPKTSHSAVSSPLTRSQTPSFTHASLSEYLVYNLQIVYLLATVTWYCIVIWRWNISYSGSFGWKWNTKTSHSQASSPLTRSQTPSSLLLLSPMHLFQNIWCNICRSSIWWQLSSDIISQFDDETFHALACVVGNESPLDWNSLQLDLDIPPRRLFISTFSSQTYL